MSKINEWDLLKREFDALTHDEDLDAESIDEILDLEFRRRFTELINKTVGVMGQAITTGLDVNDPMRWMELRLRRFVPSWVGNHR